jgi:hypothetical protein
MPSTPSHVRGDLPRKGARRCRRTHWIVYSFQRMRFSGTAHETKRRAILARRPRTVSQWCRLLTGRNGLGDVVTQCSGGRVFAAACLPACLPACPHLTPVASRTRRARLSRRCWRAQEWGYAVMARRARSRCFMDRSTQALGASTEGARLSERPTGLARRLPARPVNGHRAWTVRSTPRGGRRTGCQVRGRLPI